MISLIERWLWARSGSQAVLHSVLALVLIGFADWVTGPIIGFSIFYVIPVFGVTWRLGKREGFLMAFISAVVWVTMDMLGRPELARGIALWNFGVNFLLLSAISLVLTRIKDAMTQQVGLTTELQQALAEVTRLTGLLRVCAWCRRIRNDEGGWEPMEQYLSKHADVQFTHGICSDCVQKHHPDVKLGLP